MLRVWATSGYPQAMALPDFAQAAEAAMPEPVNLDAVVADMRARAEGWNSERYTILSPDAAGALVAEFDRLRAVEAESSRRALADDEALWRRMQPRLELWLANQARLLPALGMAART